MIAALTFWLAKYFVDAMVAIALLVMAVVIIAAVGRDGSGRPEE